MKTKKENKRKMKGKKKVEQNSIGLEPSPGEAEPGVTLGSLAT